MHTIRYINVYTSFFPSVSCIRVRTSEQIVERIGLCMRTGAGLLLLKRQLVLLELHFLLALLLLLLAPGK